MSCSSKMKHKTCVDPLSQHTKKAHHKTCEPKQSIRPIMNGDTIWFNQSRETPFSSSLFLSAHSLLSPPFGPKPAHRFPKIKPSAHTQHHKWIQFCYSVCYWCVKVRKCDAMPYPFNLCLWDANHMRRKLFSLRVLTHGLRSNLVNWKTRSDITKKKDKQGEVLPAHQSKQHSLHGLHRGLKECHSIVHQQLPSHTHLLEPHWLCIIYNEQSMV